MQRRCFIALLAGATAVGPLAARAQPVRVRRIALVTPSGPIERLSAAGDRRHYRPFFEELRRLGYVEGENLVVLRFSGEGRADHFAEVARTVVDAVPEVVFVVTGRLALAFNVATATIPIVAVTADPIVLGLAAALAHPGGNITGVVVDAGNELEAKKIELLHQLTPQAASIGYLTTRSVWDSSGLDDPVRAAAEPLGVTIFPALLEPPIDDAEFRRVLEAMRERGAKALVVANVQENYPRQRLIIGWAQDHHLPALYPEKDFADQGGLMSYGPYFPDLFRQAANYIGRILNGARPGELPFYRPTKFELVINLKTAKDLGLTVPQSLLARADEVIE